MSNITEAIEVIKELKSSRDLATSNCNAQDLKDRKNFFKLCNEMVYFAEAHLFLNLNEEEEEDVEEVEAEDSKDTFLEKEYRKWTSSLKIARETKSKLR